MKYFKLNAIALLVLLAALSVQAQTGEIPPMSGGSFTMTQSVVAPGGATAQNTTTGHGVIGQPIAGSYLSGNQYRHYTGFLLPARITTRNTAAIGGRILTTEGKGIRNVEVTITFSNGESRTAVSGASGRYSFSEIQTGQTYTVSVSAKRFGFVQPMQTKTISGDVQDLDFIAAPKLKTNEQ